MATDIFLIPIPPQQLLRQVTGKDLTEEPFLHYLRRRYLTKLR